MDIQLKQVEIEKAVRDYVAEKIGINLTGKRLGQQFSMGRGIGNLTVSLSITDAAEVDVPGYTDRPADPEPIKPSAEIVSLADAKPGTVGEVLAADSAPQTDAAAPAADTKEEPAAAESTTGGIFGN